MSSRTWLPSTARASGRCSCAAPRSTPAMSSRSSSPAGTPWPRSARRAPNAPGSCAPPNAAKAGTSTSEPVIDPDPATGEQRALVTDRAEAQADRDALANEGLDAAELEERIGELDEQITDAGMRGNVLPEPVAPPPVHQAQAGRRAAAPPPGQQPDRRQDLHRAGRQDLPAVPVRDADLPVLWPGQRGRNTRRPGHLRLHAGGPGRAALRRAVRPVHPEPAPPGRL